MIAHCGYGEKQYLAEYSGAQQDACTDRVLGEQQPGAAYRPEEKQEPDAPALTLDGLYAGQFPNSAHLFFWWDFGVGDPESPVRLPQPVQFVAHQEPAALYDADGIGDGFYVGEEVGGEEDRPAFGGNVADEHFEESATGHRVEARGRFVQDQDLRVAPQRETELNCAFCPLESFRTFVSLGTPKTPRYLSPRFWSQLLLTSRQKAHSLGTFMYS
jgi:hypothetical protein